MEGERTGSTHARIGRCNMDLCSDGHEEISYEVVECPMCGMIHRNEELELDIEEYQKEIGDLNDEIADLNNVVNGMK